MPKLRNLVIENVGLVDLGANQEAHIRLAKRQDKTIKVGETITVGKDQQVRVIFKEPVHA